MNHLGPNQLSSAVPFVARMDGKGVGRSLVV